MIIAAAAVPEYLTPGQVAALFGVRIDAVRKWADAGRVEAVRTPGGHRRYPSAQFAAVIAAQAARERSRP